MKVVSPTELSHYAVQILNCFLNYNSEQFFPILVMKTEPLYHGKGMTYTLEDYI